MRKLSLVSIAAMLAVLACGARHAQATSCSSVSGNLVSNCGFETGSFSTWTVSGNLEGGINGNYIGVDSSNPNSGLSEAYFGAESAFAQTGSGSMYGPATTLSQVLSVLPFHEYSVSFYLDNNGCSVADSGCPGYYNYFDAMFNGTTLKSEKNVPFAGAYTELTYTVSTINSKSSTLQFDFTNDSDVFYLDDVVVRDLGPEVATPEPLSFALVVPALAGLFFWVRRRTTTASVTS